MTFSRVLYVTRGDANITRPTKISRTPIIFSHSASARITYQIVAESTSETRCLLRGLVLLCYKILD